MTLVKKPLLLSRALLLSVASASLLAACDAPEPGDTVVEGSDDGITETRAAIAAAGPTARGAQFSSTAHPNGDFAFAVEGTSKVVIQPNNDGLSNLIVDLNTNRPAEIQPIKLPENTPLEWGDFDGDGRDELVVGIPTITVVGETTTQGGFALVSFTAAGAWAGTTITRISSGSTTPPANLSWGWSLAVGDFNGNGYDDLAVGNANQQARIYRGSSTGLAYSYAVTYSGVNQGFSISMTAGDFNCDGYEDLAVGVPYHGIGQVVIMSGSSGKLAQTGTLKPPGATGDAAGLRLASGNFNADVVAGRPCIDLAVAAPNKTVSGLTYAGQVNVYYSQGATGLSTSVYSEINQDTSGVAEAAESGDLFGNRIAAIDLNGDTEDDLIVETYADYDGGACNGDVSIQIFIGSSSGVQTASTRNKLIRGLGHEGSLGGSLGNKLSVTSFRYSDANGMVCPDTHITTYNFAVSNYKSLTLTSTSATTPASLGFASDGGFGDGLSHPHPGYVR